MTDGVFHPAIEDLQLPRVLAALADPGRLAIVRALGHSEASCTDIQHEAGLDIGKSTLSHHQRILREAGVLRVRLDGPRRMLTLRRDSLDSRFPGLLDAVLDAPAERTQVG